MRQMMIRYTVKPEQARHNEELVQQVYHALDDAAPDGLRYATFIQEDGLSFVHLAAIDAPDGHNPLVDLPAFTAFQKDIAERCTELPRSVDVRTVGAYRLYDDRSGV